MIYQEYEKGIKSSIYSLNVSGDSNEGSNEGSKEREMTPEARTSLLIYWYESMLYEID